jgi:multisubunit Na+/H+ antiporter MnhF subunit
MAKVTLIFAVLLIVLGLIGFVGTGSKHYTALIPAWIGVALGVFGWLAMSPGESRRKLFMHVNVTIGLLGFLGTFVEIIRSAASSKPLDPAAAASKLTLAWLLFFYLALCVRSFIVARSSGKV